MTPAIKLALVGIVFFVVLLMGHPLAFTMGGLAVILGYGLWGNPNILNLFSYSAVTLTTNVAYVCAPLFIFMGAVLERSEAADDMFESMYILFGRLRGGLAIATVVICTLLAAATGIIGASITMMVMLSLPAMQKHSYDLKFACGTIMASGCLGTIIPPSIILVIYGAQAQVSIGKLFAGGLGAGLLLSALYVGYILLKALKNPEVAPAISAEEAGKYSARQKLYMVVKSVIPTLGLIVLVLGSIVFGVATPTEAAALGCVGSLVLAAAHRKLNWQMIKECCFVTLKTNCMIMWIILGASMFTSVFLGLGGNTIITNLVTGLALSRWFVLGVILIILLIMGMFIDSYGVLLIGIPIFTPIVYALGFEPVWFGIIYAVTIQASYLSPPIAYAAFYVKGVAKEDIPIDLIYSAGLPFLMLQVLALIILSLFPGIITWLPNKML
ncbi:MAG: TRAP transporter large permease subunit [Firmicutes bacterium]|nr:TRAP transporter large permease subunit [Bacillota bacterium]